MARIAYILLCHKAPDEVIGQARRLSAAGDFVAIHHDGRAPAGDHAAIRAALAGDPGVVFARRRVKCGWGEWSLVEATLEALRAALAAFPQASHFYMLSGDCMPIKTAEYAHAFLDARDVDHIECFDFLRSDWIRTGIREERLIYRHPFNERRHRRLFYATLAVQRRLGLRRAIPADLRVMIGSQWWCLRRRTVEAVLDFIRVRPDVVRFFRGTWIPDESFFQTLVRHLVPAAEISARAPTFLMFTDYGMPVTFYNDHYDLLLAQDFLFARKISPEARDLKARLGKLYAARGVDFPISDEGRRLHAFLTGQGRVGRRFAPRIWETEASLGPGRELLIVTCKKWHVARRLVARMRDEAGVPGVGYLFDEEAAGLPDLGGLGTSLEKRNRHRRALVRMLFDHFGTDRLAICLDPAGIEAMRDFDADRARVGVLEIRCDFSDADLAGHARRIGLAGERTPAEALARLLPMLRRHIGFESDRLDEAGFAGFRRIDQRRGPVENTAALAQFLSIPYETAGKIAMTDQLFAD
ncbi:DUF5928 domain-containing protein [Rhodovulum sp.]|uniref:DUF5928 domain-containing protein n=1 Tax=Rhodovulum sp. TaxID=34009 RepID=UPI0017904CCB|nr:DUF5928 domain-containing protein [Rhodovulum sp.]HDR29376.1 glycosyl transferase [Rhodovulum sp.]